MQIDYMLEIIKKAFFYFLKSDVSFLTVATQVTVLWAFFRAWPNYIKQMQVLNGVKNAEGAFKLLNDITEKVNELINHDGCQIEFKLEGLYSNLSDYLTLVQMIEPKIEKQLNGIEERLQLLRGNNGNSIRIEYLNKEVGKDWQKKSKEKSKVTPCFIVNLKKDLKKIIKETSPKKSFFSFWKVLLTIVMVYVFSVCVVYLFPTA